MVSVPKKTLWCVILPTSTHKTNRQTAAVKIYYLSITKVYHCSTEKLESNHWHWPGFNNFTFRQLLCFSLLVSQLLMVILFIPEPFNNLPRLLNPEEDPGDTWVQRQEPLIVGNTSHSDSTTHSVPHRRTLSMDLQPQQLIIITCFSFLNSIYTVFILASTFGMYSNCFSGCYFRNHCLFLVILILVWFALNIYSTCALWRCPSEYTVGYT